MTSTLDWTKRSFMSDSMRPYKYTPLESADTIRIICLHPAEPRKTPLRASIIHVSRYAELTNSTAYSKYAALSYTWGTAGFTQQLLIQGAIDAENAYVAITPEVETILTELRKPLKPRYLWIDAISFNQKDDIEKSQQIPLMGEIYSQARKVIFWLGVDTGSELNISKVFAYFRHLALWPGEVPITSLFKDRETASRSVHQFLQRPWFFRRWILQEVVFARHGILQCGSNTMPWSLFLSACHKMATNSTVVHREDYSIQMIYSVSKHEYDLCALLWSFHHSACSDKRDRIAALYGFLPRNEQLSLNYSECYRDIYKQHAVAMLEGPSNYGCIAQLLNFGAIPCPPDLTFPSWVPDWSNNRQEPLPLFHPDLKLDRKDDGRSTAVEFRKWKQFAQRTRLQDFEQDIENQDWKLWKKYLVSLSREGSAYGAYFHVRTNELGQNVLNMSWLDLWRRPVTKYEAYGHPIKCVSSLSDSCDRTSIRQVFVPFIDDLHPEHVDFDMIGSAYASISEDIASLYNLGRLATVLEKVMSWKGSETLSSWQGPAARHFVLVCALDMLLDEQTRTTKLLVQTLNHHDTMRGRPLATSVPTATSLTDIARELGTILQQADLAVAALCSEEPNGQLQLKTYIIGPSTLESKMIVIPLNTRERRNPTPWWCENAEGVQTSWVNALVVKVVQNHAARTKVSGTNIEKNGSIAPRRAVYVGPCLIPVWADPDKWIPKGTLSPAGFIPAFSGPVERKLRAGSHPAPSGTSKTSFLSQFQATTRTNDWLQAKYSEADETGKPPPFTIDIV